VIGEPYIAQKSSNLRAAPEVSSAVVGGLSTGESFKALGRVTDASYKGSGWIAVGKAGGRLVGYVWEPLVKPDIQNDVVVGLVSAEDIKQHNETLTKEPIDLDALGIDEEQGAGANLDDLFEEDTLVVSTECRDMNVSVKKGSETGDSELTACKSSNGSWEII